MTLKIFKRDDSGMLRIFASPDEVRKPGECFEITDELYLKTSDFESSVQPLLRAEYDFVADNFTPPPLAPEGEQRNWDHPPGSEGMCRAAMSRPSTPTFSVNDRSYTPPRGPVAVICIDGCDDEYLTVSMDEGRMPNLEALSGHGYRGLARGALPSFTNVNNAAIVTGVPPSITGIGGNYFLDPETGEEVMMNSASYLRVDTILSAAAGSGRAVAMVTAKEKLLDLLARDLDGRRGPHLQCPWGGAMPGDAQRRHAPWHGRATKRLVAHEHLQRLDHQRAGFRRPDRYRRRRPWRPRR